MQSNNTAAGKMAEDVQPFENFPGLKNIIQELATVGGSLLNSGTKWNELLREINNALVISQQGIDIATHMASLQREGYTREQMRDCAVDFVKECFPGDEYIMQKVYQWLSGYIASLPPSSKEDSRLPEEVKSTTNPLLINKYK